NFVVEDVGVTLLILEAHEVERFGGGDDGDGEAAGGGVELDEVLAGGDHGTEAIPVRLSGIEEPLGFQAGSEQDHVKIGFAVNGTGSEGFNGAGERQAIAHDGDGGNVLVDDRDFDEALDGEGWS